MIELKDCIYKVVPNAISTINYKIPAFTLIEGGKRDQQIMLAGYKNHIGLYPHPTTIEKFKDELSHYKTGKGSIQFPLDQPLPIKLIIRMVAFRKAIIDRNNQ